MIEFLYCDKDGNKCLAKSAFTTTMLTCLATIFYNTYMGVNIDYSGISTLIGAAGVIYYGRSHTKANS